MIVDSNTLAQMTVWIYAGIVAMVIAMIMGIAWAITKFRTPKEASSATRAAHKRLPLILLAGLDHFADLFPLREYIPEGVLETFPFGKKPNKRVYRYALPQQAPVNNIQVDQSKDEETTIRVIKALNDMNTDKVFLRGAKVPLLVGVKNRAIAASLPFLGALNWIKDLEQIAASSKVIQLMSKSKDPKIRDLGQLLDRMSTGVSTVDFHAIYRYVDVNWDQTIQDAISERDKTDGRREGKEEKDKQTKTVMLLIMGAIAFAIILVVVAKVL